jgi:CubicO group peptidase (beta-lactamase class C family)
MSAMSQNMTGAVSISRRAVLRGGAVAGTILATRRLAMASAPASSAYWYYFDRNLPNDLHTQIGSFIGSWIAAIAFTPTGDWIVVSGSGARANSAGVPSACTAQVDAYVRSGVPINCVAFTPQGGDSWIVVGETGATAHNIPTACWNEVVNRLNAGEEITCVAFHPSGGWAVISDSEAPTTSGIPQAAFNELQSFASSEFSWPEQVAFTPDGNGYAITGRSNYMFAGNIPTECYQRMLECRDTDGRRVTHVAFSPSGGWHVSGNDLVQMPAPTGGLASVRNTMTSAGIPGAAVAVVQSNSVSIQDYYGTVHRGSNFPVSASTRFQAASISKVATAAGALHAIYTGLVSGLTLDTDIRTYLNFTPGGVTTTVTLRQLLSHTGGFNVSGFGGYRRPLLGIPGKVPGTLGILQGNRNTPAVARTATVGKYLYSGGGFVLVQRFIEQQSGQSFPTWMWNNILNPVGMSSSGFILDPSWTNGSMATAHRRTTFAAEHRRHAHPEFAAAGLYTTAADLARLVITINRNGVTPGNNTLWSTALANEMLKSQTPAGGPQYGLGLGISTDGRNGKSYFHDGANLGYRSALWGNPVSGNGVVVLTNYDELDASNNGINTSVDSIRTSYESTYNL